MKEKTSNSNIQSEGGKVNVNPHVRALNIILTIIREEEYQQWLPKGSQRQCMRFMIYIMNPIIASAYLLPGLINKF